MKTMKAVVVHAPMQFELEDVPIRHEYCVVFKKVA